MTDLPKCSFPEESLELEIVIPEFLRALNERVQLALMNNEFYILTEVDILLEDSIAQLQNVKPKYSQVRQMYKAQAYQTYLDEQKESKPSEAAVVQEEIVNC